MKDPSDREEWVWLHFFSFLSFSISFSVSKVCLETMVYKTVNLAGESIERCFYWQKELSLLSMHYIKDF